MSALTARVRAVLAESTDDHLTADHPLVLLALCLDELEALEAAIAKLPRPAHVFGIAADAPWAVKAAKAEHPNQTERR